MQNSVNNNDNVNNAHETENNNVTITTSPGVMKVLLPVLGVILLVIIVVVTMGSNKDNTPDNTNIGYESSVNKDNQASTNNQNTDIGSDNKPGTTIGNAGPNYDADSDVGTNNNQGSNITESGNNPSGTTGVNGDSGVNIEDMTPEERAEYEKQIARNTFPNVMFNTNQETDVDSGEIVYNKVATVTHLNGAKYTVDFIFNGLGEVVNGNGVPVLDYLSHLDEEGNIIYGKFLLNKSNMLMDNPNYTEGMMVTISCNEVAYEYTVIGNNEWQIVSHGVMGSGLLELRLETMTDQVEYEVYLIYGEGEAEQTVKFTPNENTQIDAGPLNYINCTIQVTAKTKDSSVTTVYEDIVLNVRG